MICVAPILKNFTTDINTSVENKSSVTQGYITRGNTATSQLFLLEWTRGAGSPAVPIVSYVTYVTGVELLRLLEFFRCDHI